MQNGPVGIIGGSGLYSMEEFKLEKKVALKTPFGKPSGHFLLGKLSGVPVVFLPRHGAGHKISPSEINFRANIWGMKKLRVGSVFAVSAVGSLREDIKPGHIVIVDQFIDRTCRRRSSFFENGIVAHVGFADPVCPRLRQALIASSRRVGATTHEKGTYVCIEGPAFSTKAESHWYKSMKADVIGMTNITEARLAREAEICYATMALSTDYDCWHESEKPVTTDQILEVIKQNIKTAQAIIAHAVKNMPSDIPCMCGTAVNHAILSDRGKITAATKKRIAVIVGKYL